MFEGLTTQQLLERWRSELVGAELVPGPAWERHRPASDADLHAAERRLGRTLPRSYREFLSASDGWPAGGAVRGLRGASTVGWFRDVESEWYEIWRDVAADDNPDDLGFDVELMARALVVSEPGDEALLLDPENVEAATGEWACYTFSNWAPGSRAVGRSFRLGLEHVYRGFLTSHLDAHPVESVTFVEVAELVERAYQAILAGDLSARSWLDDVLQLSWRAWLLAAQFDAFGSGSSGSDLSTSVHQLYFGLGGVPAQQALADPVLLAELVPLYAVRLIESGRGVDGEIRRAPEPVAALLREQFAQISAGTGLVADFSYAPAFADRIEPARRQIAAGDLDAAWETVRAALPSWTPRSASHLAPLGLYFDKDLRRLLTPPPPALPSAPAAGPAGTGTEPRFALTYVRIRPTPAAAGPASVVALPARKQHSDRTLAVLQTRFRPSPDR